MATSNIEKLQDAGLLPSPTGLTADQEKAINDLTTQEVDALISVSQKLGLTGGLAQPIQSGMF